MSPTTTIRVPSGVSGFIEDKDEAKRLRKQIILPAIERGENVVIDFSEAKQSTQSFVHALIGEVLQKFREKALEQMEFRSCNPQLKSLVRLVVDYSLGGFTSPASPSQIGVTTGMLTKKPSEKPVSTGKVRRAKKK